MKYYLSFIAILLLGVFYSCSKGSDDTPPMVQVDFELSENEIILSRWDETLLTIKEGVFSDEQLVWISSNEDVATVVNGLVVAQGSGSAKISVSQGDLLANCSVKVLEKEYELVWSDEFDGTELNEDNWTYDIGNGSWGWGVGEQGYSTNRKDNVRVENGLLTIEAKKEEMNGFPYTTGRIKTRGKKDFTYGRIEARFKVPSGTGTWPAIWMLGYNAWPGTGEIDVMEHVGFEPKSLYAALHSLNKNGLNGNNYLADHLLENNVADDFHIVRIDWLEKEKLGYDSFHIYIDGTEIGTYSETAELRASGDWPFNYSNKFHFVVNMSIGGNWGGIHGIDDSIFENPVLYQVDYLRVYQLKDIID